MIQNIVLNEIYLDLLENKYTIDECYKDLKFFILEGLCSISAFYIFFIVASFFFGKNALKNFILIFLILPSSIMNLYFSFKYLKPNYKPTKSLWIKTKEDNFLY